MEQSHHFLLALTFDEENGVSRGMMHDDSHIDSSRLS
jgi:hypothetical protein